MINLKMVTKSGLTEKRVDTRAYKARPATVFEFGRYGLAALIVVPFD